MASRVSLEAPVSMAPHTVVVALLVVLMKVLWDPEASGVPLAGSGLPRFAHWAHALHRRRARTAPMFAARCAPPPRSECPIKPMLTRSVIRLETHLQRPRAYAKFVEEQVLPLTRLRGACNAVRRPKRRAKLRVAAQLSAF